MKITEHLTPLAAESGTPLVPVWQQMVLASFLLSVIVTAFAVWAVLRWVKSKRG
ncbi:hypothetical protein [Krasilnikovia sp. MM14-A1259]|uniref:hypothetical protein n=1 Tax=Krasilnikovia sp. MM14-A1259 TaxID=3373539 RepID=UPI00399D1E97